MVERVEEAEGRGRKAPHPPSPFNSLLFLVSPNKEPRSPGREEGDQVSGTGGMGGIPERGTGRRGITGCRWETREVRWACL